MRSVSISELKANLSRYLREVRRGGEIRVLHRGTPVARLLPCEASRDDDRQRLIAAGILRPGRGDGRVVLDRPPLKLGTSILEALLEERREARF